MRRKNGKSTGDRSSRKEDKEEDCKQIRRRFGYEFTEEDKKMGVVLKSGSEMRGRLETPRK